MFCQSCTRSAYSVLKPAEQGRLNQSKYREDGRGFFLICFVFIIAKFRPAGKYAYPLPTYKKLKKLGPRAANV